MGHLLCGASFVWGMRGMHSAMWKVVWFDPWANFPSGFHLPPFFEGVVALDHGHLLVIPFSAAPQAFASFAPGWEFHGPMAKAAATSLSQVWMAGVSGWVAELCGELTALSFPCRSCSRSHQHQRRLSRPALSSCLDRYGGNSQCVEASV